MRLSDRWRLDARCHALIGIASGTLRVVRAAATASVLPGPFAKPIRSRHFEKILAAGLAAGAFYVIVGRWLSS